MDMNIYLLKQDIVDGYETFDSAVVVAESEDDARTIHPRSNGWVFRYGDWVEFKDIDKIKVTLIGVADPDQERGVILASFNAG